MVRAVNIKEPQAREGRRPRDLARQLGVAPTLIYAAINEGEFGPVWRFGRTGRAIVIPEAAVQRWLASKEEGSGGVAA